jgi:hypothetical protein
LLLLCRSCHFMLGHLEWWHAAQSDARIRDELSTGPTPPSLTR